MLMKNGARGKLDWTFEIFSSKMRGHYIYNPTFITDYPVEMSPLYKKKKHQQTRTGRAF
jgi:lysyl-tRNA synthetase class 2